MHFTPIDVDVIIMHAVDGGSLQYFFIQLNVNLQR